MIKVAFGVEDFFPDYSIFDLVDDIIDEMLIEQSQSEQNKMNTKMDNTDTVRKEMNMNKASVNNKNSIIPLQDLIEEVIQNDPATVIKWKDGTKTIVKAHNESFDPEKGFAMAVLKYMCGNTGNFNEILRKYI